MRTNLPDMPSPSLVFPPQRRIRWAALAIALVVLLMLIPFVGRRLTDLLWYEQIGFARVFLLQIVAQWTLAMLVGVATFAVLFVNGRIATLGIAPQQGSVFERLRVGRLDRRSLFEGMSSGLMLPACLVLAFFAAVAAGGDWRTLVQFIDRSPFGTVDPVFGRDVSYYVFTLPQLENLIGYAGAALSMAFFVITLPIYVLRGRISFRPWQLAGGRGGARAFSLLLAALIAIWGLRTLVVDVPLVLVARHGPLQGASYTDLHMLVPAMRAMGFLGLGAGAFVLVGAWRGRFVRNAIVILAATLVLNVALVGIAPSSYQRLVVQPNELARERTQLKWHIDATRRAWGIDSVDRRELDANQSLTMPMIDANHATITNVRLWDREPLLQTFGQVQAIRTYYNFVSVDDDRYRIGGELRQVLLSARELDVGQLPTRSFVNEHLTYTHGLGLTLGPSNQVTPEGLPVLWVKDLPPVSSIGIKVTRPEIYFGEIAGDFILAPSRQREFDYPAGEGDSAVYSTYKGRDGVSAGSFLVRLLFAMRFQSLNILLSSDLTPETKVVFHRNVRERAMLALPFLRFDTDPYMVVSDSGRLKWILDAYTSTDRYPYSQQLGDGTNYLRNSVKVVIDAYDGDVTAYLADPADPMIRTLARIYPGLLHPLDEMPADLRAHLRYPGDLFNAQTVLYATFHMTDPETFYHKEDQWQVPRSRGESEREGFMRHMVMRLPGEKEPEYILMRPFTPRQKDNLAAWMVARNDGAQPREARGVPFPAAEPRVRSDADRQSDRPEHRRLAAGDALGPARLAGDPRRAAGDPDRGIAALRAAAVPPGRGGEDPRAQAGGGGVREPGGDGGDAGGGVEEAVRRGRRRWRLPTSSALLDDAESLAPSDLAREAAQHYDRARAAQRADDWATYGAEMQKLWRTCFARSDTSRRRRRKAPRR